MLLLINFIVLNASIKLLQHMSADFIFTFINFIYRVNSKLSNWTKNALRILKHFLQYLQSNNLADVDYK